jgi:hypothetical protein
MSDFWQNLGAAVGIGAATVAVDCRTPCVGWGESANGTVALTGGEVAQQVKQLTVSLVEHWTTTTMVGKTAVTIHHYQPHATTVLASDFALSPGESLTYEYSLPAPWYEEFSHHWFIGARAEIPAAVDRGAQRDFKLTAPPEFRNLAAVLTEVCRIAVQSWHFCQGRARAELIAREEVRTELDGVRLEVNLVEGRLVGQVVVNPQEKDAGDVLRSLVMADRHLTPFNLALGDAAGAKAAFEAALRPHTDALRTLPIPATDAASGTESLPIASDDSNV